MAQTTISARIGQLPPPKEAGACHYPVVQTIFEISYLFRTLLYSELT